MRLSRSLAPARTRPWGRRSPVGAAGAGTTRRDAWTAALLAVGGMAARAAYLAVQEVPLYDPWRHLALVRNLRQGLGFTLFDGQPYIWYSPIWYYVCAALPPAIGMEWTAALLSALSAPLLYLLLRRWGAGPAASTSGGLLMAGSGPVLAFTCHYGPEAAALFLTLAALLACAASPRVAVACAAGLAFGLALVLRLNFAGNAFLFLPWLRGRRQLAGLLGGAAVPLLLTWWRNHRILERHAFVFTWDGLAARSADFDLLSTLVVQMHPAVQEALRRLHEQVVPRPEWLAGPHGPAWALTVFVLCGVLAVLASRRLALVLAALLPMGYFLFLDRSLSSNFFRIYLPLFPAFFLGIAFAVRWLSTAGSRARRWGAAGLVAAALLSGAGLLRPTPGPFLADVTPPISLLDETAYLVNSGRYHPESLIYRFPERRFVGMPLQPDQLEEFLAHFPAYRTVLWHDFSVQPELQAYLAQGADFSLVRAAVNPSGRVYRVFRATGEPAAVGPESPDATAR